LTARKIVAGGTARAARAVIRVVITASRN